MFDISKLLHKKHKPNAVHADAESVPMDPLYPKVEPEQHGPYIRRLNEALAKERINNLALTGSYGSGKSSILEGFEEQHKERVIRISFSALGTEADDFIAITGISDKAEDRARKLAGAIQKEIVKQLLFKKRPTDVPNSKFRRVSVTHFRHIVLWAALLSAIFLTGLVLWRPTLYMPEQVASSVLLGIGWLALVYLILVCLTTIGGFAIGQKIRIDKLSGGPISLTVSPNTNYFDDFLDEIIYFFEATKYDIVVLEDIDRFKNMAIFEQLRQLNMILNSSEQVNKRVLFIYAVRDSIFAENTTESVPSADPVTNRTKFFDLLIPIVPFVTYRNSRDLVKQAFDDDAVQPSEAVIRVVAKYLTDMRVIKNIRNEYLVFYKSLITDGNIPNLSPDKLFAMIVYKNLRVKDFEETRLGTGSIEQAYKSSRAFVAQRTKDVDAQISILKDARTRQTALVNRAMRNGQRLYAHIADLMRQTNGQLQNIKFDGGDYGTEESQQQLAFWQALSTAGGADSLVISYQQRPSNGYSQVFPMSLSLTRDDIASIVGDTLNVDGWRQDTEERDKRKLAEFQEEAQYLKVADMQQVVVRYGEADEVREIATSTAGLLYDLIVSGYIDRNYMLYTSVYHGVVVAPQAMSFIMQHVDTGTPDLLYDFGDERAVAGLLRELGPERIVDATLYNVQVIDYLLKHPKTRGASRLFDLLARAEEQERNFISVYLQNGKLPTDLIEVLSSRWDGVFDYLLMGDAPWRSQLSTLVNAAIKGSNLLRKYPASAVVRDYITENVGKLDAITNRSPASVVTARVSSVLNHFAVEVPHLAAVNPTLRPYIIERNLYRINEPNLRSIMQGKPLALDEIRATDANVYQNMITHSAEYLKAIETSKNTPHTVIGNDDFSLIITNLVDAKAEALDAIIAGASANCLLASLEDVSAVAWPAILDHALVANTFSNAMTYADQENPNPMQVDEHLVTYLNVAADLSDAGDEPLEERRAFVIAVLGDNRIDVDAKVAIAKSAELGAALAPGAFPVQTASLYTKLLAADLLEDDIAGFDALTTADWSVRSAYLAASKQINSWGSEVKLNADEIVAIVEDGRINSAFKHFVVEHLSEYGVELSDVQAEVVRKYVISEGIHLGAPGILLLAHDTKLDQLWPILKEVLTELGRDDFVQILSVMHDPYSRLALSGGRVNLTDTQDNVELLARLAQVGVVSKYPEADVKGIRVRKVSMRKWA